jgi:hypothetical protein
MGRFRSLAIELLGGTDPERVLNHYFSITSIEPTYGRSQGPEDPLGAMDLDRILQQTGATLDDCEIDLRLRHGEKLNVRISIPLRAPHSPGTITELYNRSQRMRISRMVTMGQHLWSRRPIRGIDFEDALGFSSTLNELINRASYVNPFRIHGGRISACVEDLEACRDRIDRELPAFLSRKSLEVEFFLPDGSFQRVPFARARIQKSADESAILSQVIARISGSEHHLITRAALIR